MPFTPIGGGRYRSPSGRTWTKRQVVAYYATGGFKRKVRRKRRVKKRKVSRKVKITRSSGRAAMRKRARARARMKR